MTNRFKIILILFLVIFFGASVSLAWYIAKRQVSNADVISSSVKPTTSSLNKNDSTANQTNQSSQTSSNSQKVNLILQPGYNLKTIPYILSPNDGKTVFLNLISQKVRVLENGHWEDLLSGSRTISPGQAFLIYSQNGEVYSLPVSAKSIDQTKPFTIHLIKGWNAIGNPFLHDLKWKPVIRTSKGSTTLAKAIEAHILSSAFKYDAAAKEYQEVKVNDTWRAFQGLLIKAGGSFDLIIDPTIK